MYIKTNSVVLAGLKASIINVEVDVSKGLPAFAIVGLASKSITEAKERVTVAMNSSGFEVAPKRILVNLSPAHIKKEGVHLDLAIAAALMAAFGYINSAPEILEQSCLLGELALTGELRPVVGVLPMAIEAKQRKMRYLIVAAGNETEAALVLADSKDTSLEIFAVSNLEELKKLLSYLTGLGHYAQKTAFSNIAKDEHLDDIEIKKLEAFRVKRSSQSLIPCGLERSFSEVIGQAEAKRGLEIAAAGRHHVLMIGPPGCGKSMLAKRFINLLPALSFNEALELSKIHSISGLLRAGLVRERPLRAPHHTSTITSLIGGGVPIRPGEVSLAHHGVLFLDELTEFDRHVIEVLRQILEEKKVSLARGVSSCTYPADFTLVAACNPCPCGYLGDTERECSDSPLQVARYVSKLSGPLLDRIDIHLELSRLNREEIESIGMTTDLDVDIAMRSRVSQAQDFAAELKTTKLELDKESKDFVVEASYKLGLSARSYTKILNLSRTIANLAQTERISLEHVAEALQYRSVSLDQFKRGYNLNIA